MAFNLTYLKDIRQGVPASDFAAKGCLNPRKIWVYDNVSGRKVEKYVNCGHCLRCFDQKREEFTTRMFLHAIKHKYVYFVTLTYGSYNLNVFDKHPFKNDWLDTHPVLDSYNSSHRPRWTPTLVIQSHVQKFFKRLRKMGFKFSYVAAGELGETWSRPHHHLVIFSNDPISHDDFKQAWSYLCVRTGNPKVIDTFNGRQDPKLCFRFPIGRVDYNDLYANGSMNYASPTTSLLSTNALKCFNYVAKYICKVNFTSNAFGLLDSKTRIKTRINSIPDRLPSFAIKRLRNVYDSLDTITDYTKVVPFQKINIPITKPGAFGPDDFVTTDLPDDVIDDYADDLLLESLYRRAYTMSICNSINDKSDIYDIKTRTPRFVVAQPNLYVDFNDTNNPFNPKCYETKKVLFNGRWLYPCDFDTFVQCFSQYFTFSRATPIGMLYFEEKCTDFEKGNFSLPKAFGKTLEFPSYFYSLLARKRHPFCFRKTTFSGISFVKSNLSLVYEFYSKFIEDKSTLFDIDFRSLYTLYHNKEITDTHVSGLIDPYYSWHGNLLSVSFVTHNKRIHYYYDFSSDEFHGYIFDRHLKEFVFYDSWSRVDMCIYIMRNIEEIFADHPLFERRRSSKTNLIDLIKTHESSYNKVQSYLSLRKCMSDNYKVKHLNSDFQ